LDRTLDGDIPLNAWYSEYSSWWDHRTPLNNPSTAISEKEYIGRIEPVDSNKQVHYKFRLWRDNGTTEDIQEDYDYINKWFELNLDSVLTIPINDEHGEYIDDYTISGMERYAWYDGTILSVPRTSTFAYLKSFFGLTISMDVLYEAPSNEYNIKRVITFIGQKVNNGSTNTFTRTWVTTATYTETQSSPEGAQKSTETGTRVIKWG
jgi:hypothetical protein